MPEYKRRQIQILHGLDEMLLSGLTAGAERMIGSTYNFMASLYYRMEDFKHGDIDSAARHQLEAVKIIKTFLKYDSLPAQNAIMCMVGVDPLVDLSKEEEEDLRLALKKSAFFKWSAVERPSINP